MQGDSAHASVLTVVNESKVAGNSYVIKSYKPSSGLNDAYRNVMGSKHQKVSYSIIGSPILIQCRSDIFERKLPKDPSDVARYDQFMSLTNRVVSNFCFTYRVSFGDMLLLNCQR